MSDLDRLISQIPLAQVAATLGVDEQTASEAVNAAIPALIGGLGANAQDPSGEASLMEALGQHQRGNDATMFNLDDQDQQDGSKIVQHIFGGNTDQVVNQLAGSRNALGSGMLMKLLPLLAPIVLQWLAGKWTQRSGAGAGAGAGGAATPSGGTGQAPAGFPTDNTAQPQDAGAAQQGGGLGDLLGGLLGGSGGQGGGLGDLLGGLLGGGRR